MERLVFGAFLVVFNVIFNDFHVQSIQKLRCNHVFHPECIYKWLDINKRCPMCREEIDRPESLRTQPGL